MNRLLEPRLRFETRFEAIIEGHEIRTSEPAKIEAEIYHYLPLGD